MRGNEEYEGRHVRKASLQDWCIYTSMIAAGTMPPPVRRSASTDAALDVVDSGLAGAPIIDSVAEPKAEQKA